MSTKNNIQHNSYVSLKLEIGISGNGRFSFGEPVVFTVRAPYGRIVDLLGRLGRVWTQWENHWSTKDNAELVTEK